MKKSKMDTTLSDRQLEIELKRAMLMKQRLAACRRWIATIIVLGAAIVLAEYFLLPVYRITNNFMELPFQQGEIVLGCRIYDLDSGDFAAVYYDNQIQYGRVIGTSGDLINIDEHGNLTINNKVVEEENLHGIRGGQPDFAYPYRVSENSYFILVDRDSNANSGMPSFACIGHDNVAGKIIFRIWPLQSLGYIG